MKIKTFESFIHENEIIQRFNDVADNFLHPQIPNDFQVFKGQVSTKGNYNRLCYSNALETYKNLGLTLCVGMVFDKKVIQSLLSDNPEYINFSYHAWNIDKGKIYDCTLGKNSDTYIGKEVPNRIADNLKDGSEVREILYKHMKIN